MNFMLLKEIIKLGALELSVDDLNWLNYGVGELLSCMTKECLAFYIQTKMNGEDDIKGLFFYENNNIDRGWLVVQEEIRRLGGVEPFLDLYDDSGSTSGSSVYSTTDSSSGEETDDDVEDEGEDEDEDIYSHDVQPREEIENLLQMSEEALPVKKMVDSYHGVILNGRGIDNKLKENTELLRRKAVVQSRINTKGWGAFKEEVIEEEQRNIEVATNGLNEFISEVSVFSRRNRCLSPDIFQIADQECEDTSLQNRIFSFYYNKFGPRDGFRARVPKSESESSRDLIACHPAT